MSNAIDDLMSLDPLELTPEDISSIIDYHRRNRQNFELGIKPKKETGPVEKINLAALGLTTPEAPIKRRV